MRKVRVKTPLALTLDDEHIVAAWASPAAGPGWANTPIKVLIQKNGTHDFRVEYIQPGEQTREMHCLYRASAAVAEDMRRAVEQIAKEKRK